MTSQSCGRGRSHVITFGLFSSHDEEVPAEEEQTAEREEEEGDAAEGDGEGEETDEVTPKSVGSHALPLLLLNPLIFPGMLPSSPSLNIPSIVPASPG